MHLVLKDIVTYAAIHEIDQVSRYAAKALCALELQEYEDERKTRLLTRAAVEADLALVSETVLANLPIPPVVHKVVL